MDKRHGTRRSREHHYSHRDSRRRGSQERRRSQDRRDSQDRRRNSDNKGRRRSYDKDNDDRDTYEDDEDDQEIEVRKHERRTSRDYNENRRNSQDDRTHENVVATVPLPLRHAEDVRHNNNRTAVNVHLPIPPPPQQLGQKPQLVPIEPIETDYPGHHHERWYFFWPAGTPPPQGQEQQGVCAAPSKTKIIPQPQKNAYVQHTTEKKKEAFTDVRKEDANVQTSRFWPPPVIEPTKFTPEEKEIAYEYEKEVEKKYRKEIKEDQRPKYDEYDEFDTYNKNSRKNPPSNNNNNPPQTINNYTNITKEVVIEKEPRTQYERIEYFEEDEEPSKQVKTKRQNSLELCQYCGVGVYKKKVTTAGYIAAILLFPCGTYACLKKKWCVDICCTYCGHLKSS